MTYVIMGGAALNTARLVLAVVPLAPVTANANTVTEVEYLAAAGT